MDLVFKDRKLVQIGNSVGFIVDSAYVKNGLIDLQKTHTFIVTPNTGDDIGKKEE